MTILGNVGPSCLIVDDSTPFLEAARALLEREGIGVVGLASTSAEALRLADELCPDLVLVDIDLGPESGLDLARELGQNSAGDKPAIVLISSHGEEDFEELIAESPAAGFVGKSSLSAHAILDLMCDNRQ